MNKIRKVSKKRSRELAVYEKEKKAFLQENPVCMFPGCESEDVTLHHAGGRCGTRLTDRSGFRSLCWPHHQWAELHPIQAKELGLSVSRLAS